MTLYFSQFLIVNKYCCEKNNLPCDPLWGLQDILSPVQAGFRPGRSTVDQFLLLSQSIADSFHQSKPGARTVLATVDFAKAFDSVWHSALLSKLLSLDLPLCFVE